MGLVVAVGQQDIAVMVGMVEIPTFTKIP